MMKRTLILLAFVLAVVAASAQDKLKVETFWLSNGMKVILAEDHSEPQIFGSVIVHAGSKHEDTAATGVAHYFEHMMFKGTDRIGTTDWAKEKPYLDSISAAYDRLHDAGSDKEREAIQLEINRLNIEASKYAIPNETDAILRRMGCTGLNAATSQDFTRYFNFLPSNQLENWMEVYAERFRNPVYRLFQGELETVYEEKNISDNKSMIQFIRRMYQESFGSHPYSRDVIGYGRHLKNPQPSAMKRFYDKYYVASNMTLLLVGDLDMAEARKMAERHFGSLPRGEKAGQKLAGLPQYDKQVVKKVRLTPLAMGFLIFPGVDAGSPDKLALDVANKLITGGNGLLDRLSSDMEIMAAQHITLSLEESGLNAILYVPIPFVQSHKKAEKKIFAALDSLAQGRFSDALLESIKMQALRERMEQMESLKKTAMLLQDLETAGSSYQQWLEDNERLQRLTRQDIMDVASRYFNRNHCTILRSKMGNPKPEMAIKPAWEHLEAQNAGAVSPFAQRIYDRPMQGVEPQVIDFQRDVAILDVTPHCKMYATANPRNDIFTLKIKYHYGTLDNRNLETAVDCFELLGADSLDREAFSIEVERLGGSFYLTTGSDYTTLSISGFEQNFDTILGLVMRKVNHPRVGKYTIDIMVENMKADRKGSRNDAGAWANALLEYAIDGDSSTQVNRLTIEELKQMKVEDFLAMIEPVYGRDGYVTYVGNRNPDEVARMLAAKNLVRTDVTVMPLQRRRAHVRYGEDAVLYATNGNFSKSDIYIMVQGPEFDNKDEYRALVYDDFMGGGMNSVLFQEIREFRSLGYSTYTTFSIDRTKTNLPVLLAYLGTQCDKTGEGVEVMTDLITRLPDREDKFRMMRDYLVTTRNAKYIGFRDIPQQVRDWMELSRLTADPRAKTTEKIKNMTFDELSDFHRKYIEGRPRITVITGNAEKFSLEELSRLGKLRELKFDDLMKF